MFPPLSVCGTDPVNGLGLQRGGEKKGVPRLMISSKLTAGFAEFIMAAFA